MPILWDNYPVNDQDMRFDPHIRPLRGRSASLKSQVRGVVANLGLQPKASRIGLHTIATWWRDPERYDPELAWDSALRAVASSDDEARALRILGELANRSDLEPEPSRVPALDRFLTEIAADPSGGSTAAAIRERGETVEAWRRAGQLLLGRSADRQLRVELAPWSQAPHLGGCGGRLARSAVDRHARRRAPLARRPSGASRPRGGSPTGYRTSRWTRSCGLLSGRPPAARATGPAEPFC